MNLSTLPLGDWTLIATAGAAGVLAAFWLSLVIWTFRDIRRRAQDPFTRILAVAIVILLFLPGFLIYLILRPSSTLEEEYQRTLEEEALLQNIEDVALCPGCNRHIQADWILCPTCHTLLKKHCPNCNRLMELPWNICPYCATPVPGVRLENITTTEPVIENSEILSTFESGLEENVEDPDRAQSDSDWISLRRAGNEGPQPETQPPAA